MLQLLLAWKKKTKKDIPRLEEGQNKPYQVLKQLNNLMGKFIKPRNFRNA